MSARDRHARLLELVHTSGSATVEELSATLNVAPSTVRRDLRRLSANGRIIRSYGGAIASGSRTGGAPSIPRMQAEKRRIAAAAASLVEDGQTIAVSSGTTAVELRVS